MNRRWLCFSALVAIVSAALCLMASSTTAPAQNQGAAPSAAAPAAPPPLPWAFPVPAPGAQRQNDDGSLKHVPESTLGFTRTQIDDPFNPPDWYPDDHPPMPEIVAHGRKPDVRACPQCHLPNGLGGPESSSLAGQPAVYILQQMVDYRSGVRKDNPLMTTIAKSATDADLKAAADYFASLKMRQWIRVVEADTAPKSFVALTYMRLALKEGGTEPIGQRIIELPEDSVRAESKDSHAGFVAYVPVGSIKKGAALVTTGGGRTIRCSICHGPDLKGLAGAPGIAGRPAIYVVRQLYNMQNGSRAGLWADLMKETVSKLTVDDMINIAAYTASRVP